MKGLPLAPLVFALAAVSSVLADPPNITNQPQDVLVNKYSAAQFTVGATGAVSYQWSLNNAAIAGATNAELSLDDVTNSGNVSVTVLNGDGQTTSRTAALNITPGTLLNLTISGYPNGESSNVVIALFDHDKPVTVENFLHYIESGAYSNMIFERLVVDPADSLTILQGGDYDAEPQTNGVPTVPSVISVTSTSAAESNPPPFVVNQYTNGPIIHNRAGTIAMAKLSSGTQGLSSENTAENGFFFNLADNSTNLDNQNGGFTVFGRVISGMDALNYFLQLSKNGHGIFDSTPYPSYPATFTDLPVNFQDFQFPVNSNLFYGAFSPVGSYPAPETSLPTVAITQVNTNNRDVIITGTASDAVGIAQIFATVLDVTSGQAFSPTPVGTTNWTMDCGVLPAGLYQLQMDAENGGWKRASDAPGSPAQGDAVTLAFSVPAFPLYVTVTGSGAGEVTVSWKENGTNNNSATATAGSPLTLSAATLSSGSDFVLSAKVARGSFFGGWSIDTNQTVLSTNVALPSSQNGGSIAASFMANGLPGGITMTSPKANAQLTNGLITLAGKLKANLASPTVTCQILDGKGRSAYLLAGTSLDGAVCAAPLPPNVAVGSYVTITGADRRGFNGTFPLTYVSAQYNEIAWGTGSTFSAEYADASAVVNFNTAETAPIPAAVNGNAWSAAVPGDLAPGAYVVQATVTDANGKTETISQNFEVLAPLTVVVEGPGKTSSKSKFVVIGRNYSLSAAPAKAGAVFYDWDNSQFGENSHAGVTFPVEGAVTWQATFIANNLPVGFKITSPSPNGTITQTNFTVSGTLPNLPAGDSIARVTCEVFTNGFHASFPNGSPLSVTATNLTATTWSAQLLEVPVGVVTLVAVAYDTAGNSRLVSETVNVNAFGTANGTYNGIFFDATKSPGPLISSGLLHVSVTSGGVASGTLRIPGATLAFPVHAKFKPNGATEVTVGGINGSALGLAMDLPIGNSNQPMPCAVGQATWVAQFTAQLAATSLPTNDAPGNYVLNLIPQDFNAGIGYAFVNVSNNATVSVVATLPDGVTLTEGTSAGNNGFWPIYLAGGAYKTRGALVGWEQITNVSQINTNETAEWVKNRVTGAGGAYYPSLSTNVSMTSIGGLYAPPTNGQYSMVFSNGTLTAPITTSLSYSEGQFSTNATVTSITIDTNTGAISGQFTNPNPAYGSEQFQGAFINPAQGGGGFVLDANGVTAAFELKSSQ